ncbi:hypothetical protein NDU88_006357 [Pleurodeles waltl]|uniref:Uncharacterized protein n=1 Tax=Pleurodeles waltl TaxID=8319 RepID=A0AAV7MZ99_PLEWA|nr:hypothetical protein NDU88_006357 [Pleurodeles waltl]
MLEKTDDEEKEDASEPDEGDVLGGAEKKPGRREAGEVRARRKTRFVEELDNLHQGAAMPEKTEDEEKEEASEGRHRTK